MSLKMDFFGLKSTMKEQLLWMIWGGGGGGGGGQISIKQVSLSDLEKEFFFLSFEVIDIH